MHNRPVSSLNFKKQPAARSIVRRQVVAGAAEHAAAGFGHLLAQPLDFAQQRVDLLLLADDDLIELVEQVFVEAGLDFQLGQAVVGGVVGFGRIHALIGHELALHWR